MDYSAVSAGQGLIDKGQGLIDDVVYSDTSQRGYMLMTNTAAAVRGEYAYVSNVKLPTYTQAVGRTVTVAGTAAGTAAPVTA